MTRQQGINTKEIGEQLSDKISNKDTGIRVFYDHGDSSKPGVCQPTAYMGKRYGRDATLSGVDIVVTKGKDVILAIEIEESMVRPKTVLGDIFGIALADRIRISKGKDKDKSKGKNYSTSDATIVVAVVVEEKGKRAAKYVRLERLLNRYFKEFEKDKNLAIKKVRIVPCPEKDLVRRIERLIRLEVGKRVRGDSRAAQNTRQ